MGKNPFEDDPLTAGGFGPSDSTIRVRPGPVRATLIRPRLTPSNRVWEIEPPEPKQTTQQKINYFNRLLPMLQMEVQKRFLCWRNCAIVFGNAYKNALENHRTALKNANDSPSAVAVNVVWSLVATLATGGVSFIFAPVIAKAAAGAATTWSNAGKDTTEGAASAIGNVGPSADDFKQNLPDPVDFKGKYGPSVPDGAKMQTPEVDYGPALTLWLNSFEIGVITYIQSWVLKMDEKKIQAMDMGKVRQWAASFVDKCLNLQGLLNATSGSLQDMIDHLETCIWAEWIIKACENANPNMPEAVAERFKALEILRKAGVTSLHTHSSTFLIGGIIDAVSPTKDEDAKLVLWAKNFKEDFDGSEWATLLNSEIC